MIPLTTAPYRLFAGPGRAWPDVQDMRIAHCSWQHGNGHSLEAASLVSHGKYGPHCTWRELCANGVMVYQDAPKVRTMNAFDDIGPESGRGPVTVTATDQVEALE